jgi:hypothetical protein
MIWKTKPSHEEVEALVNDYFKLLNSGQLDQAESLIPSEYEDWHESIFTVWEDHYLIHEIPNDSSFEGNEWLNDRGWLKNLTIKPEMEWMNDDIVWADFVYRKKVSGYIGEFVIQETDGGFTVKRTSFQMA